MAANTITRDRLRRLADVKPERGRVLSVFLNLDPTEFATPAARSTAITSVMTEAAHRVDQADGLDHEERQALRADVDRVREALRPGGLFHVNEFVGPSRFQWNSDSRPNNSTLSRQPSGRISQRVEPRPRSIAPPLTR